MNEKRGPSRALQALDSILRAAQSLKEKCQAGE